MRFTYLPIFLIIIFYSCNKKVLFEIPAYNDKPVVNCLFSPDEPFMIQISKSASKLDTSIIDIKDAIVEIYQDDNYLATLSHTTMGYYTNNQLIPEVGILYTLKVQIPEYPDIVASDSIPSSYSEFEYLGYKHNVWYSEEGTDYSALEFKIKDNSTPNYFEVLERISYYYIWDSTTKVNIKHFTIIAPLKEESNWRSIFTDRLFNGNKYNIDLLDASFQNYLTFDSIKIDVQVIQGSPTYYKFRSSTFNHQKAQYSNFLEPMEPVNLYSNIENGFGIFAGYQSKIYPIIEKK